MFTTDPTTGFTIATDLPALIGTDKQIAWATDIRAGRARFIATDFDNRFKAFFLAGKVTREQLPDLLRQWWEANAAELSETSAARWIERRGGK